MSLSLRLAIVAALALAGAAPASAADPAETAAAAPAGSPEASTTAAARTAAAPTPAPAVSDAGTPVLPPLVPLVTPPPAAASPLLPPLLAPAIGAEPAPPVPEPVGPPAALASTPAMRTGAEVFARLRRGLSPNSCNAGSNSSRWRQRYAGSPTAFSRRLESVLPLLDFVSTEVERAGLPAEFSFIPLVESWYQPGAIGPGGPAGMWQMIGTTAKNHGIHIRPGYDGRLSPVESTRAALSYLKVLDDMFGNWQAIVMAYNAGEGRLQNALRRAGSRTANAAQRKPHGLSNITYDYVDKLQALSCMIAMPQVQGLRLPVDAKFEPLMPLLMGPDVSSLEQFAKAHGKDAALLRRLNPGFRDGRVVAGVPRLVLSPPGADGLPRDTLPTELPANTIASLQAEPVTMVGGAEMLAMSLPSATPSSPAEAPPEAAPANPDPPEAVHEVREGDTIASIARHYQLPEEQILRANHLDKDAQLRTGQRLRLVP
jgi:membrane-bound lytic murein transglycosylase D